ncbi:Zinc finger, CCCH-type [Parasponia andersonii]|uniref:Zinc finger, CCCH-type n=1 Tax=Parasponia andersonii TaxID=3476 RepID=A0A2P5ARI5_PARAD|nr:Zinc finger, CCCH-type [Parasponia andersonii]
MPKHKKRSRTLKRVSWAPGLDLCQVKLFSSEDCPAKVGMNSQDDLQAKSTWTLPSNTKGSNDLPPGFERGFAVGQSSMELPCIPRIQWKCPPKIVPTPAWQVVSGEESEEVKNQKSREMRVLEAVYPRVSSIPTSPSVSLVVENEYYDDNQTPLVSLTPIEEEESPDTPFDKATPVNTTLSSQQPSLPQVLLPSGTHVSKLDSHSMNPLASTQPSSAKLPDLGADVVAATYTALAAFMTCSKSGNLIDTDLLVKILNDPKLIANMMNNGPPQAANTGSAPISESKTVSSSVPLTFPTLDTEGPADENSFPIPKGVSSTLNTGSHQQDAHPNSRFQQVMRTPVSTPTPESYFSIPNQVTSAANVASVQTSTVTLSTFTVREPARPIKDLNYYKNLIKQHGGEKVEKKDSINAQNRENYHYFQDSKPVQNYELGEMKSKNTKPCAYFKTSKGCWNGANCPFQHDVPKQWRAGKVIEGHSAKRMKLNGEIYGSMLV